MRKLKLLITVTLILSSAYAFSQEQIINVSMDTYIRGGSYADDNYGNVDELYLKGHPSNLDYERQMLYQFDLSPLSLGTSVIKGKIRLYCTYSAGDHTITLYETSDGWTEEFVTWNNAPSTGEEITSFTITDAVVDAYIEIDIPDYIFHEKEGDKILSLIIADAQKSNKHSKYLTKEAPDQHPELIVEEAMCDCDVAVPQQFNVSNISSTKNILTWDPVSCCAITGIKIERKIEGGVFEPLAEVSASVSEYTDKSLSAETQYTYRIQSYGSGKESAWSPEKSVTTASYAGNTYYMDATGGDDNNDGLSAGNAWKSLNKINNTALYPGDQVLLKSGEKWIGTLHPKGSGVEGKPIKIGKYGEGDLPTIQGPGTELSNAIYLYNQSYWEISDIKATNPEPQDIPQYSKRAIYILAKDAGEINHIHIKNVEVTDVEVPMDDFADSRFYGGIYFEVLGSEVKTWFNDILFEGCYFHHLDRTGLSNQSTWWKRGPDSQFGDQINDPGTSTAYDNWVPSTNIVVRNCRFEHIGGNGLIMRVSKNTLVEDNYFTYCAEDISGNAAFCFNTDSTIFQGNEACYTIYNDGDTDARGIDSDFRTKHTIIQYNYLHHNGKGGVVATGGKGGETSVPRFNKGTIIRYNVLVNNEQHIVRTSGILYDMSVYNNLFYSDASIQDLVIIENGNWGGAAVNGAYYYNNIFYIEGSNPSYDLEEGKNNLFSNNAYFGASGVERNDDNNRVTTDPLLSSPGTAVDINDLERYKLTEGSPCIGSGRLIEGAPVKDLFGVTLDTPIDIGVHQFSSDSSIVSFENTVINDVPLRFFPSPANSLVNIVFNESVSGVVSGVIHDLSGRRIASFERKANGNSICLNLDHLNIKRGTYILQIQTPQLQSYSSKLIKK